MPDPERTEPPGEPEPRKQGELKPSNLTALISWTETKGPMPPQKLVEFSDSGYISQRSAKITPVDESLPPLFISRLKKDQEPEVITIEIRDRDPHQTGAPSIEAYTYKFGLGGKPAAQRTPRGHVNTLPDSIKDEIYQRARELMTPGEREAYDLEINRGRKGVSDLAEAEALIELYQEQPHDVE
jgi:hypothetical protein